MLLTEICRRYPDTTLIVDEAFIDFARPDVSSMTHSGLENLVVLRSPNKMFGIAGTRTGVIWTENEELRLRLSRLKLNWALSQLDVIVARGALRARAWADETRDRLLVTASSMERLLLERFDTVITGVPVHYRFLSSDDPKSIFDFFLKRGIVVRFFLSNERGRIPGVRITAPTETEFTVLQEALS
jgi:histidinol-phosphate aminotransferase